MIHLGRSLRRLSLVCVAAVPLVAIGLSGAASASATREGTVLVVSGDNIYKTLSGGELATVFSLSLPKKAACPGDTMHDDWRYSTFFIPSTVDPGSLRFSMTGPANPGHDARISLYEVVDKPFLNKFLEPNDTSGKPGTIPPFPAFYFGKLPFDYLPSGTYLMGVACSDGNGTTRTYWDTQIEVSSSASAMTWKVVADQPKVLPSANRLGLVVWLSVIGAVLLVLAIAIWVSPWPRPKPDSEEHGEAS